jgi:VWFA-related protein
MVYAIGIDSAASVASPPAARRPQQRLPLPGGIVLRWPPGPNPPSPPPSSSRTRAGAEARVNEDALRMITDDTGGRTEIVTGARNLDQATAGIASELSQQYFLGYVSTRPKDGRWHTIRVQVKNRTYQVRARRGFVAG